MKRCLIIVIALLITPIAFAQEPQPKPNLMLYKYQLDKYYESGDYLKDVAKIANQASLYLNQRLKQNAHLAHPKKLAIVFDIDETVLSNYPTLKQNDYNFPLNSIHANQPKADDKAIPSTLALYQSAIKNHVAVFFITGRTDALKEATVSNLKNEGFKEWSELVLKPNDYQEISVIPYKAGARKKIEEEGYDIVLSIGDQRSDLLGGYADKTFKLPNPYYYIP